MTAVPGACCKGRVLETEPVVWANELQHHISLLKRKTTVVPVRYLVLEPVVEEDELQYLELFVEANKLLYLNPVVEENELLSH